MAQRGRPKGSQNKSTKDVKRLALKYSARAMARLADLMDNAESEQARVAACKEILDRAYGKSPQAITGPSGEGPVQVQWLAPAA